MPEGTLIWKGKSELATLIKSYQEVHLDQMSRARQEVPSNPLRVGACSITISYQRVIIYCSPIIVITSATTLRLYHHY